MIDTRELVRLVAEAEQPVDEACFVIGAMAAFIDQVVGSGAAAEILVACGVSLVTPPASQVPAGGPSAT